MIRAAGGVPCRRSQDGRVEVLLVHRPRYDDWTLPKGKCDRDETDEACAIREVKEETGLRCELLDELPSSEYHDGKGRRKIVRYWRMLPRGGAFLPHSEVDEVRWLTPGQAAKKLSYDRDRRILEAATATKSPSLLIVRHAVAGKRRDWKVDDRLRPLDERGQAQARRLVSTLSEFDVGRVFSSPYLRCSQTVEPLARARGLPVEGREELAEGAEPNATLALLRKLDGRSAVLCTHGDVIEALLGREGRKGASYLVALERDSVKLREELPPPA